MKTRRTICITGGHLTPALAVIEKILEAKKPWDIVWVGRATSLGETHVPSEEKQVVEKMGIRFIGIASGRFNRFFSLGIIREGIRLILGFFQACKICLTIRPDIVFSFGGYVGFPMVIAAWLFGIPVVVHEQTHVLGFANRVGSLVATLTLLSFENTKYTKNIHNTIVTGLPVRSSFFSKTRKISIAVPNEKPLLYITGGTTGAKSLNLLVFPIVEKLTRDFVVVHQTGTQSLEQATSAQDKLPEKQKRLYLPFAYIQTDDVAWIMQHMELIIARSGANTTAEVAVLQKRAIFIPLPWSADNEQWKNAEWYKTSGNCRILNQKSTTSDSLYETITKTSSTPVNRKKSIVLLSHAADSVVENIDTIMSAHETNT